MSALQSQSYPATRGGHTARVYDVAVIGASVAGSAAARLFAARGLRVALIEQKPDPAAYKVACTHAVLPAATPVLERLGVARQLERLGVPRTSAELWTPYGGWVTADGVADGWGVTRRTLDPLLRGLAVDSAEVDYMPDLTARVLRLSGTGGQVELDSRDRKRRAVRARLIVGADGRNSTIARLAGVPGRVWPHHRFFHFAYWRGVKPRTATARPTIRLWVDDLDSAAEFPNEDGLTVLVTAFHASRRESVRGRLEAAYVEALERLPDGPDLKGAERVSKILGKVDTPNVLRPAARPGVAFVGDAAVATDPVFGCGISFALLTAGWLVDAVADDLRGGRELGRSLGRYRRRVLRRLGPHHAQIADFSRGETMRPIERRVFAAAAHEPQLARALGLVLTREHSPLRLLDPRLAPSLVRTPQPGRRHSIGDAHTPATA